MIIHISFIFIILFVISTFALTILDRANMEYENGGRSGERTWIYAATLTSVIVSGVLAFVFYLFRFISWLMTSNIKFEL